MFDIFDEISEIEKRGVLGVARCESGGNKSRVRDRSGEVKHAFTQIERGVYVPDEAHIDICLNCERKTCTGYCKLMSENTRKRVTNKRKKPEQEGDI